MPVALAAIPLNPGVIDTDMLRLCFAAGADGYIKPDAWAAKAAKMMLGLSSSDNGKSLSV